MSEDRFIPSEVDELDAAWFSASLGRDITSIEILDRNSGTTGRARVALHGEAPDPEIVFVKLPPFDELQRSLVDRSGMGVAEAIFYRDLAREIPESVPVPEALFADTDGSRYVMVLADLGASGCRFPTPDDPDIEHRITDIVERLATLHAAYWDSPRFGEGQDLHWLTQRGNRGGGGRRYIQQALDVLGDEMGPTFRRLAQLYIDHNVEIRLLWEAGTPTLVHGDTHIGNLYVDTDDRTGFLDWAVLCANPGIRDVAYTICNSLPHEVRARMERPLIDRYRNLLADAGIALDADSAWNGYRLHAAYSWLSAAAAAGMGSRWQTVEVGLAATRRTTAACEEIGSVELLEELLG